MIKLRARFDGNKIVLDEPFELEMDSKLIITVLANEWTEHDDAEREAWLRWSMEQFDKGYSEDEPDYPLSLIK